MLRLFAPSQSKLNANGAAPVGATSVTNHISRRALNDEISDRAAVALLIAVLSHASATAGPSCIATDGDTLRCGHERVRIRSIDAPEMRQPGGREARDALAEMIRDRTLSYSRDTCDRYGRTLAHVTADGRGWRGVDLGAAMVAAGHADWYRKRSTARACR